jgi:hypothetical protein
MRVNAANLAKVMLRRSRIPLVEGEHVRSLYHFQPLDRNGSHNCSFATAQGTIASPQIFEAIFQFDLELHGPAVTFSVSDSEHVAPAFLLS